MEPVKLYRYTPILPSDTITPDFGIDYTTGLTRRLDKDRTPIVVPDGKGHWPGEYVSIGYYDSYNQATDTFSDMILKEDINYTYDAAGNPQSRSTEITYYREDGTPCTETKSMLKIYRGGEAMERAETRRRRAYREALLPFIVGALIYTGEATDASSAEALGMSYLITLQSYVQNWLDNGYGSDVNSPGGLGEIVANETGVSWLDNDLAPLGMPGTTIRQVIILNIGQPTP